MIDYSEQSISGRKGKHSETVNLNMFTKFVNKLNTDVDIMLEIKDKEVSVLKVIEFLQNASVNK